MCIGGRGQKKDTKYQSLPIEEKESHRWIQAAAEAGRRLEQATQVTVVADREADIYELLDRVPNERTHVLVRASFDRHLVTQGGEKLFEWCDQQPVQHTYRIDLEAIPDKRSAHRACLQVRFSSVVIKRPKNCSNKSASPSLVLNAIDVVEEANTVVGKEKAVHWRLLTTHDVRTVEQACQCIEWYCQRWHIEQVFRTLKRQGVDMESSLVESAHRLEKLAVMALGVAVRTMQLTLAREGKSQRPATDAFDHQDIEVLKQLQPTLEGKTEKQKNAFSPLSLAWACWIIARLGGWKGYASERKPGPITMLNGLKEFESIKMGFSLARQIDVCIR